MDDLLTKYDLLKLICLQISVPKSFARSGECLMMSWPGFYDCRTKLHPRVTFWRVKGKKPGEKRKVFVFKADRTTGTAAVSWASV